MNRTILLPLFLCAACSGLAQSGPVKPAPTWKAGDKRQVTVTDMLRLRLDSATYDITKQSTYLLEVLSSQKDGFVLSVRTQATDAPEKNGELKVLLSGEKQDGLTHFMQNLAETMYTPLDGLESRFNITLAGEVSGQIDPVSTVEALRPALEKVVLEMRDAVADFRGRQPEPLPKARMDYLSDSLYAVLVRSQVHELHRLMRIYGTTFPLTGSQRARVTVKDVRSPLQYEYLTLPAILEAGLDMVDTKKMTCRTITTYDADALFAAMTKDNWTTEVQPADLHFSDECVTGFDRTAGWPTASTSEMEFRCGALGIHISTRTNFEELR